MNEIETNNIYLEAKVNPAIRAKLIEESQERIYQITCHISGRTLSWENDDELSIGLIAFNEAIDTYEPEKGKSFWGYANLVIKHRLLDYFRREANWKKRTLYEENDDAIGLEIAQLEAKEAFSKMRQEETDQERAEKVILFEQSLREYKIVLGDLAKDSPKHRDTRANLLAIANALVENEELLGKLFSTKQLPIKELMLITGQSRKVLETGRRYLIALTLILSQPEFAFMKDFLQPLEEVGICKSKASY